MKTEKPIYGVYKTKIDQEGKIQLSPKAIACLPKDVVLVGHGDHIELWGWEEYKHYLQSLEGQETPFDFDDFPSSILSSTYVNPLFSWHISAFMRC